MKALSAVSKVGLLLALAGAVNWGLVGIFEWNGIAAIFGDGTQVATFGERIIYVVVLAGGLISVPLFMALLQKAPSPAQTDRRRRQDYSTPGTGMVAALSKLGLVVAFAGAVNWGVIGIFEWNPIGAIFTDGAAPAPWGERIVYMVILGGAVIALPLFAAALSRVGTVSRPKTIRAEATATVEPAACDEEGPTAGSTARSTDEEPQPHEEATRVEPASAPTEAAETAEHEAEADTEGDLTGERREALRHLEALEDEERRHRQAMEDEDRRHKQAQQAEDRRHQENVEEERRRHHAA